MSTGPRIVHKSQKGPNRRVGVLLMTNDQASASAFLLYLRCCASVVSGSNDHTVRVWSLGGPQAEGSVRVDLVSCASISQGKS